MLTQESLEYVSGFEALALDVDGSAIINEPKHLQTVQVILGDCGSIDWAWWKKNLGSGQSGIWRLLKGEFPDFRMEEHVFVDAWKKLYCELIDCDPQADQLIRPGLKSLVEIFKAAGKPVFAVSASEEEMVLANLNAIRLNPPREIDFALTAKDVHALGIHHKPAPDQYLAAFRRADVEPRKVMVLEDTDKGVRAAFSAGAGCIIGVHASNDNPHAHATIHTQDCYNVLASINHCLKKARVLHSAVRPAVLG